MAVKYTYPTYTPSSSNKTSTTKEEPKLGFFENEQGDVDYQPNYVWWNFSNGIGGSTGYNATTKLKKTGLKVKDTGLAGSINTAGKSMDDQNVWTIDDERGTLYYVWVGDGKNNGYYVSFPKENITNTQLSLNYSKLKPELDSDRSKPVKMNTLLTLQPEEKGQSTTKKYTTPSYSAPKAYDITKDPNYKKAMDRIDELEKMYAEATRVWTADEVAKHLGVEDQYNKDNILKMLNEQTNEYYDNAVAEQQALRNDYVKNNAQYIDQLTDSYIDSTKYVAPTATNRGIQAANLMTTSMTADTTNSMNDYGMYQNVLNQEKAREAELKQNDWLATEKYNNFGTVLSNWSATKNESDVQQYIDSLKSATNYYAADRAYQAYLSQANATKYAGLAGASQNYAANAAQAANSSASNFANLWNFYYNALGQDADAASKKVSGLLNGANK